MLEKKPESNHTYSMPVPIAGTEPPSSTFLTLLELWGQQNPLKDTIKMGIKARKENLHGPRTYYIL